MPQNTRQLREEYQRAYYLRHREKKIAYAKARGRLNTISRYGLTESEFMVMSENQDGRCAICRMPPTHGNLRVDHDHRTGRVRGLLCNHCNLAAGLLFDDSLVALALSEYLNGG